MAAPIAQRIPTGRAIVEALGGRWRGDRGRCLCPAHADRSPSLDVAERGGRVLVVCRAHCAQADVIEALRRRGLWTGLPAQVRRRHRLSEILDAAAGEALLVAAVGDTLQRSGKITDHDQERLRLAVARLTRAAEVLNA